MYTHAHSTHAHFPHTRTFIHTYAHTLKLTYSHTLHTKPILPNRHIHRHIHNTPHTKPILPSHTLNCHLYHRVDIAIGPKVVLSKLVPIFLIQISPLAKGSIAILTSSSHVITHHHFTSLHVITHHITLIHTRDTLLHHRDTT